MSLSEQQVRRLAETLETAEHNCRAIAMITTEYPSLSWPEAYAIQAEIRRRKESRGQRVVGLKAGLTSRAKMKQMQVSTPVFGVLFDYMGVADGGEIQTAELIHPKVEAEIGFVLKADLRGPGCHVGAVLAATDFVVAAVEVIDSRYEKFQFDLASVIADNTSAARFAAGSVAQDIDGLDLATLGIVMQKNGEIAALAAGAAVLGNPAAAVAQLANHLHDRGEGLPAGSFVMSGGATEAIPVSAGDSIQVRFQGLGQVSLRFV